jgi:hypothetical protein
MDITPCRYCSPANIRSAFNARVSSPYFDPELCSRLTSAPNSTLTFDVGSISDRIEVQAAPPQLNTVDASQGQVIENRRIVELPLNGRTYDDLALLSAGATQPLGNARFSGFSSGGMRDTQSNFILDGVDNNPVELAGAQRRSEMVQPSIDGIQEFKVQTNAYAAEYGGALGGVVNVTTKSGANALHGTAFEFVRNEKLDAKNFFAPPGPKASFKRNQYGFLVGGPVYIPKIFNGKNKVFFFADYEGTRFAKPATMLRPAQRPRCIPAISASYSHSQSSPITDPTTGKPFAGNIIPLDRQDPLAKTLIGLYPAPMTLSASARTSLIRRPHLRTSISLIFEPISTWAQKIMSSGGSASRARTFQRS